MYENNVYHIRESEIERFLVDIGRNPNDYEFCLLDDLCRDVMVLTGNFFKPTGFEELCGDYGVIAFSKDITEQALSDAILAVKNPDAPKKNNRYYPPYNIFQHMVTTVIHYRADPTSFMEKEVVDNIICAADIISKYIGTSEGLFKYDNEGKTKNAYPIIHSILTETNPKRVYVTPFGVILQEPDEENNGLEMSIIRFTKYGKYTFLCRGFTAYNGDEITHTNIGPIEGNKYDLRNDQLNAKLFPRSYACVTAYQSFIQNHLSKIDAEESPFTYAVCHLLNRIFSYYQDAKPTYYMIDLAVPNVIGAVITMTLASHCVLTHEFNIS